MLMLESPSREAARAQLARSVGKLDLSDFGFCVTKLSVSGTVSAVAGLSTTKRVKVFPSEGNAAPRSNQARGGPALLEDFQLDALSQLHARRLQDGADGLGRAPLAAYHFPEIAGVDAQLEHGDLFAFDCTNLNLVGIIHERLCDRLYQLLHLPPCALVSEGSRACACKLNLDSTTQLSRRCQLETKPSRMARGECGSA